MKNLVKLFASLLIPLGCWVNPVSAAGELTVEYESGETDVFADVEISNTEDIIYFQGPESDSILMITKNECDKEGELLVCSKARVGLQSYGVLEELNIEKIYLFINSTDQKSTINGSQITMSPNTILLEFVTDKGSFVSGFGSIDSTTRPEEALR